jgi:hypothetical protein
MRDFLSKARWDSITTQFLYQAEDINSDPTFAEICQKAKLGNTGAYKLLTHIKRKVGGTLDPTKIQAGEDFLKRITISEGAKSSLTEDSSPLGAGKTIAAWFPALPSFGFGAKPRPSEKGKGKADPSETKAENQKLISRVSKKEININYLENPGKTLQEQCRFEEGREIHELLKEELDASDIEQWIIQQGGNLPAVYDQWLRYFTSARESPSDKVHFIAASIMRSLEEVPSDPE